MPQALLMFDLDAPDEREELNFMLHSRAYEAALFDYDQWLRSQLKHFELDEATVAAYETAREQLHSFLDSHGVELP